MKIIQLKAENIKRLIAVEIIPKGNLVQITGKNGNGKTSVLDAIWWCLSGGQNIQAKPIRTGENQASVVLDLGEMVVTRKFKINKDGETTSSLTVENKEGVKFSSPQALLDKLLGDLTFDPLGFARMEPKKQFETLRKFVPSVDFDAIDKANKEDYDTRTDVNRQYKACVTAADQIKIDVTTAPTKLVDESAMLKQMEDAAKTNADIETRRANRKNMENRIKELQLQAKALLEECDTIQDKLRNAGELPAPVDISELSKKITEAQENNKLVGLRAQKVSQIDQAARLGQNAEMLTKRIEKRNEEKQKAIAAAQLPVKEISFGDGQVLISGVPFNQASDAEQLRVSLAIAMALNPKLQVIRVRDGSLLDDDSMKIVEQMANEKDFQVWIERVDGSGNVGFVMEAGEVRDTEKSAPVEGVDSF
jgi:DNA repair exonuclease SbcCD ATPase subunit